MGLVGTPCGLKGALRLFTGGRRKAASVARLLQSYFAVDPPGCIETVQERPGVLCLFGLSFSDVQHLAMVAEKLAERHFPLTMAKFTWPKHEQKR